MDLAIWAWVLIGIGSALFTTLTWLPVGAISQRLLDLVLSNEPFSDEPLPKWTFCLGYLLFCVFVFCMIGTIVVVIGVLVCAILGYITPRLVKLAKLYWKGMKRLAGVE